MVTIRTASVGNETWGNANVQPDAPFGAASNPFALTPYVSSDPMLEPATFTWLPPPIK